MKPKKQITPNKISLSSAWEIHQRYYAKSPEPEDLMYVIRLLYGDKVELDKVSAPEIVIELILYGLLWNNFHEFENVVKGFKGNV